MKKAQKILSSVVSLLLASGMIYIPASAYSTGEVQSNNATDITATAQTAGFINGDFEFGGGTAQYTEKPADLCIGWYVNSIQNYSNTHSIVNSPVHSGNNAAKIDVSSGTAQCCTELRNPTVGKTYRFSYWLNVDNGVTVTPGFYVRGTNAEVGSHNDMTAVTPTGGNWVQHSFNYTVNVEAFEIAYIRFDMLVAGTGSAYIDDVSVEETTVPTYGSNKIDTNFSSSGWKDNGVALTTATEKTAMQEFYGCNFTSDRGVFTGGSFSQVTDPSNANNKVLKYTNTLSYDYFGNQNDINNPYRLTAGKEYTLTYRYKVENAATAINVSLCSLSNAGGDVVTLTIPAGTANTDWQTVTHTFTARSYSSRDFSRLLQVTASAGSVVYFDDVSLSYMGTPYYENKVEKNYDGTVAWGRASSVTDPVNSSNKVLKLTANDAFKEEAGSLVSGDSYTLSFRYNIVSAATDVIFYTSWTETNGQNPFYTCTDKNTGWKTYTYTFTGATNTRGSYRPIEIFGFTAGDEIYIDDVVLTHKVVSADPVYTSGKYQDANAIWTLKSVAGVEFYRDSLTMTPGKTYRFSYDIKTENCPSGFDCKPYLMDRTNGNVKQEFNDYRITADRDWQTVTFEYFCDGTGKNVIGSGEIIYRLGYGRTPSGNVYTRNFSFQEIIYPEAEPEIVLLSDASVIPSESSLTAEKVYSANFSMSNLGDTVSADIPNVVSGKRYLLSYKVHTSKGTEGCDLSASLGTAGFSGINFSKTDACISVCAVITAQESGTVTLSLTNSAYALYSDVVLHRAYDMGDVTGDDSVDVRDLVRYKKYFANTGVQLATNVYADVTADNAIDTTDMVALRRLLLECS